MALLDTPRAFSQPAVFADWVSRAAYRAVTVFSDWNNARRTRNALIGLTAHELDDIGLCRGDIDDLARKTTY